MPNIMIATLKQSLMHLSLAEQAYHLLEGELVTLRLPPGELVSEKELMDAAQIGRTPVREAIQRLSAEGLLKVLPRKGLMVTALKRSDLTSIIEICRVLERLMVVKSTERARPDQRRALEVLAIQFESVDNDFAMLFNLGYRLDELLDAACHNQFLVKALSPMRSQCRRVWYLRRNELDLAYSAQLLAGLARAVANQDVAGAIRAMNELIAILEKLVTGLDVIS